MMDIDQIYLGDAMKLIKGVPDKSVDLIVTDPPYEIKGLHTGTGLLKNRKVNYIDAMIETKLGSSIDLNILPELVRVMKKINIYLWCNKEQIYDYMTFFVKERKCNFEFIIWAKSNPPPFTNGHYLKDKEYCLYFWETGVKLNTTTQNAKTVYFTNTGVAQADKKLYDHPTIKPLEIIKNLIEISSSGGGLILDPFAGSGTTAVAAKMLDRHFIGFEISAAYHQIAVDRLAGITQPEKRNGYIQTKLF